MKRVIGTNSTAGSVLFLLLAGATLVTSFVFRQAGQQRNNNWKAFAARGKAAKNDGNDNKEDNASKRNEMDPAKRAALAGVLSQIERNYGRGSVVRLGDADNMAVDSTPSGALTLDAALGGGGYPKGRVVEIYGPESSGKTTLALHAIAECQKKGETAAFVDAEHALDPAYGTYNFFLIFFRLFGALGYRYSYTIVNNFCCVIFRSLR